MDISRIIKSVHINEDGCWIWQRSCNSAGYGQLTENRVYWLTHRYVYHCINGNLTPEDVIRHTCHNTKCCNPDHLVRGTHKDNWHDSIDVHTTNSTKRRFKWVVGQSTFSTIREANKVTGISQHTLLKFTDKNTRIFDIDAYRKSTIKAGWVPKI